MATRISSYGVKTCWPSVKSVKLRLSSSTLSTLASPSTSTANSFISLGKFETMGSDVGRMATGIVYLEEATKMQETAYAAESDPRKKTIRGLSLAKALLEVGRQHHQQQDALQAVTAYSRSLELFEAAIKYYEQEEETEKTKKALGYTRFALSEVCSSLGVAYNDSGRLDEATQMHQRALEVRKGIVGKNHPSLAECFNNLGGLFFTRGNFQKAVEHFEEAFELLTEASAGQEDSPYVALTLYNLGLCRASLGHMQTAKTTLSKALQMAERCLGPDHRQVELIRETLAKGPSHPPNTE